jgi:hypothetical protein
MNKSLLIGLLLLTSAARASAQYAWTPQTTTTVPTNAVKDPLNHYAVCKSTPSSLVYVGYLSTNSAGTPACIAVSATGTKVEATANLSVLTPTRTTSDLRWVEAGTGFTVMPSNLVLADGYGLCTVGGYVGKMGLTTCITWPAVAQNAQTVQTVLTW